MARTFNESKSVFLAGPIEFWWNTEEEPRKFYSQEALVYRWHREKVREFFVENHFLVYSPHDAFKGDWNEKMQPVNDFVLGLCDIVVDMSPRPLRGQTAGTSHEWELAQQLGKKTLYIPDQVALDAVAQSVLHSLE